MSRMESPLKCTNANGRPRTAVTPSRQAPCTQNKDQEQTWHTLERPGSGGRAPGNVRRLLFLIVSVQPLGKCLTEMIFRSAREFYNSVSTEIDLVEHQHW